MLQVDKFEIADFKYDKFFKLQLKNNEIRHFMSFFVLQEIMDFEKLALSNLAIAFSKFPPKNTQIKHFQCKI